MEEKKELTLLLDSMDKLPAHLQTPNFWTLYRETEEHIFALSQDEIKAETETVTPAI